MPDATKPLWMSAGKKRAQSVAEELLAEKGEENLPPFAKQILAESNLSLTRNSYSFVKYRPEEKEILSHIQELWVVLRKIARTVILLTFVVMIIPGIENGRIAISPYNPAVLQILTWIINFAKRALVEGTPSTSGEVHLYIGSPLAPISLYINLALFIAVVLSIPITVKELFDYIRDALTYKEYEVMKKTAAVAAALFTLGATISFVVIMPVTLRILAASGSIIGGNSLEVWYGVEPVLNLLLWGTLGAGVLYASPMVLLALIYLDILPAEELSKRRRELILGIFTVAAIVTPDPTLVSMVILSLPMLLIIEGIIYWGLKLETERLLNDEYIGGNYL